MTQTKIKVNLNIETFLNLEEDSESYIIPLPNLKKINYPEKVKVDFGE